MFFSNSPFLTALLACFLIFSQSQHISVDINVDGRVVNHVLHHGQSTFNESLIICKNLETLSQTDCEVLANKLSHRLYGVEYTSSCLDCSVKEYLSTRMSVLEILLDRFDYHSYLEIGTDQNQIFKHMEPLFDRAVGVDPLSGGTLRMTSDDFFENNQQQQPQPEHFDLIFIDGLHEANQAYRDIKNALEVLNPNGTLVVHDCNPFGDPLMASFPRPLGQNTWTGDTWKAAVALRMAKDVEIVVVDVDYGVGVLRPRLNTHPLTSEWQRFLGVNPVSMLQYKHHVQHRRELHRLMSLRQLEAWLDEE